jgi:hypothetical protein
VELLAGGALRRARALAAGRVLNVAVCPADTNEPPRVLNYLTAPHVYVWSAVSCSSAFPLLFEPQELYARDHRGNRVKCARAPGGMIVRGSLALAGSLAAFANLANIACTHGMDKKGRLLEHDVPRLTTYF